MYAKSILTIFLVVAAVTLAQQSGQNGQGRGADRQRLTFKVSARALKGKDTFGTIDPYLYVYYTENEGTSEKKLGRSETISFSKNPDWTQSFVFDFDRSKRQRWHFYVYDHDNFRRDEKAGEVWVTVSDFVDNGQHLQVNLNKKGYLIIKKA